MALDINFVLCVVTQAIRFVLPNRRVGKSYRASARLQVSMCEFVLTQKVIDISRVSF